MEVVEEVVEVKMRVINIHVAEFVVEAVTVVVVAELADDGTPRHFLRPVIDGKPRTG